MANRVLASTEQLAKNSEFVFVNSEVLDVVAKRFAGEDLKIPFWDAPVFLDGSDNDVFDFFLVGNAINFAYTDFATKQKWSAQYRNTEWKGAFGMWACLRKAFDEGIKILDGEYLKNIDEENFRRIFAGNFEIPLLNERLSILREVGLVLCEKYAGHFHNLVEQSEKRLFNGGNGLVERLTADFPSFNDSAAHEDKIVYFDKRAQLGAGMLYGRFQNKYIFDAKDAAELSVFADYVLPKALRDLNIISYEKSLAERIDAQVLISANSREELEIRAVTVQASKLLVDKINDLKGKNDVNALHVDYKLWSESRVKPGAHHLTITTAY